MLADKPKEASAGGKKIAKPKKERRFHPVRYVREVYAELKKVTWPTREELLNYTIVVVVFVAFMTVLVGIADFGMSTAFRYGIGGG